MGTLNPIILRFAILFLAVTLAASGCRVVPAGAEVTKPASQEIVVEQPRQLRNVDGGLSYFQQFSNPLPSYPSFFPVGVWRESILTEEDVRKDAEAGINVYVDLTTESKPTLLNGKGIFALLSQPATDDNGTVLADEPDMWAGFGDAKWTGNWPGQGTICDPPQGRCGYTVQRQLANGVEKSKMKYANYGKGVTFWSSDQEAARFINEFQDVVSADNYWFTDPNICGATEGGAMIAAGRKLDQSECRLAANYGKTVDRVRSLLKPVGGKPVWSFVEVGQPFKTTASGATGAQIRAAVWSSIIHGARGIVYFNHSFGGPCPSFHVLRESCAQQTRAAVTSLNRQVTSLAPVLNAPFLDNAVKHSDTVSSAIKVYEGSLFILTASTRANSHSVQFELPCLAQQGGSIAVLDENRSISMVNGVFSDEFDDGNAVHLYRIDGAAALCVP